MAITVSIPKPCSEKWSSFEKTGNTGFCSSCQKHVVDFTKFSDKEIIDFFNHNHGKTCGRFLPVQLKTYGEEKRYGFNRAAAILTAGILTLSQAPNAMAQKIDTPYVLSGQVFDAADNSAVAGVNIVIKDTRIGTSTDVHGNFTLEYNPEDQKEVILQVSFVGYVTREETVKLSDKNVNVGTLELEWDVVTLGDVCIVYPWYTPRGMWSRITSVFRR